MTLRSQDSINFESIQLIVSEANCDSHASVCFAAGGLLVHHGLGWAR